MKNRLMLTALGVVLVAGANAQIAMSGVNTAWVEISGTGTNIGAVSDDSETIVNPGFGGNALLAGGTSITIGNNGAIIWNPNATTTQIGYSNGDLTTMAASDSTNLGNAGLGPRQFLAVQWDDLFPSSTSTTGIFYQMQGSNLIVEWQNEDNFNATGSGVISFEAIIYGSGGPAYMDYVYNDTLYAAGQTAYNDGAAATIGYKDWGVSGRGDAQWSLNTASVAGWVENGGGNGPHGVRFAPVPEPASMAVLGIGALVLLRRRNRKA
jgi:hypothetical protein